MIESLPPGLEELTVTENDFSDSPHMTSKSIGIALISEAAGRRNLKVSLLGRLVFEVCDDKRRVAFLQNSPVNSSVFSYCARKKHLAKTLMKKNGIPVPSGGVFTDLEDALRYFEQCNTEVALKPTDGSHGTGVSTGISSRQDFLYAWDIAKASGEEVIVEQSIKGYDLRVIVIGGKAIAAYVRVPANVLGDGTSTIRQLVERKNQRRKLNPSTRNDYISRFDLLERAGRSLDDVPRENERVWLASVANVSVGGEVVQFIDHVSPEVLLVAERAARSFPGLPQVGVDLIVRHSGGLDTACVIEVNSNPGISDAVFPSYGRSVDVPAALLEHVFDGGEIYTASSGSGGMEPAPPYGYVSGEGAFSRSRFRQVELVKQAAFANNIPVEDVSDSVFMLSCGDRYVAFHQGMPDKINVISRKICRSRKWLLEFLERDGISTTVDSVVRTGSFYRFVIVNNKLVAGLCIDTPDDSSISGFKFDRKARDVTDEIHPDFVDIALKAVDVVFNPFLAGIDILAGDIRTPPEQQPWCVSDIVCNPFLSWHHFPGSGLGRNVAGALVRELFPETANKAPPWRCLFLTIRGKVQGVGFRSWLHRQAVLHGVHGWVRNSPEGNVEAMIEGTPVALGALQQQCNRGPATAVVSGVSVEEMASAGLRTFVIRR